MVHLVLMALISLHTLTFTAPIPKEFIWECVYVHLASENWHPIHCAFVDKGGEILNDRWPNMLVGEYTAQLKAWMPDDTEVVSNIVTFTIKGDSK